VLFRKTASVVGDVFPGAENFLISQTHVPQSDVYSSGSETQNVFEKPVAVDEMLSLALGTVARISKNYIRKHRCFFFSRKDSARLSHVVLALEIVRISKKGYSG
jgi:hypothetical protein